MPSTDLLVLQGDAAEESGDYARARALFQQGADLGDEICLTRLAYMFDVGIGVSVDKAEAMRWYRQAWRQRTMVAANNIAILYRERGNRRAMFRWFERAALEGDGSAAIDVAKCYLAGVGVRRNPQEALRWLATVKRTDRNSEEVFEEAEAMLAELRPRSL